MKTTIAVFLALALSMPVLYAPAAWAGPAETAAELKKQGDLDMDALRYEEAIAKYTEAYRLSKDPALLYNRGRVYQARSQYVEALADLLAFQKDASPELRARVPALVELIDEIKGKVASVEIRCAVPNARVVVRDRVVGTTPLAPLQMLAGSAKVEVTADGYEPYLHDENLVGGKSIVIEVVLRAKTRTGVLTIRTDVPARAFVDGVDVGETPVEITREPGTHKVVLRRPDFDDYATSVVVTGDQKKSVSLDLPKKSPVTSKWWFWTGAGVIVVGTVATVFALTTEKSASSGSGFGPGQVRAP
jgi:hypothetical protein